jgi:flagellar FliL protein
MTDRAYDDDAAASTEAKPGRSRKLILFAGAPVLALLLIGGAIYFTGLGSLVGLGHAAPEGPAPKKTVSKTAPPTFFDLPELLVNINAGGKRSGFLKLAVSLELDQNATVPQLQAVLPRIVDNFQTYLRELRVEDLKGSAGLYRLREELMLRVNAAVAPARINDVLFKEMLVQ